MSAKDISARQHTSPLTLAVPVANRNGPRARVIEHTRSTVSPGRTRTLKAHLVQARIERRRTARFLIAHQQHAAVLGEHLALNHAGDDRISRKMPLQKVLVARDRDLAVGLVAHQLGLVEQKHRFAMR